MPGNSNGQLLNEAVAVLIVDSDLATLSFARWALAHYEFNVLAADTGAKALHICKNYQASIDLLITDVTIADMPAWDLVARVKETRPKVGVIFLSSHSRAHMEKLAAFDPDHPFVRKPFTPATLVDNVRLALRTDRSVSASASVTRVN
jgi:DNA-binding response OmpR family regulator